MKGSLGRCENENKNKMKMAKVEIATRSVVHLGQATMTVAQTT